MPVSHGILNKPLLFQISKGMPSMPKEGNIPRPQTQGSGSLAAASKPSTSKGNKAQSTHSAHSQRGVAASNKKPIQTEGHGLFWRLARMEFIEALFLLIVNALIVFVACWQLKLSPGQVFSTFWPFMAPLHFLVSWAYFMLPIVLTGSSVAMLYLDFGIADPQPEKRISFSLFMLLSVILLPLSFLCMILTPAHATLAELMTGQEVRERSLI
jgi:hypothetical protein